MRFGRLFVALFSANSVRVVQSTVCTFLAFCSLTASAANTGVSSPFEIPQGAYQAEHVEDRDNVSIIEFSGNYDKKLPSGEYNPAARATVAQEFYRTHADDYDFLIVFSEFEFESGDALAFYNPVRNDVQGIGKPIFDLSSLFGSAGKLQGYIDMAALSRYETSPFKPEYEQLMTTMAHEVLHRWAVSIDFRDKSGQSNSSLIGRDGAHWSFLVDTAASVEYGHDWQDLGNGEFKAIAAKRFFSPMDLYLMGFYAPDEVPPFFYIESSERDPEELPQPGITLSGEAKTVTVEDVIAEEGPRIPSSDTSQKQFKFGLIYLKSPSTEIDEGHIQALKRIRKDFATRFSILTGGRGIAQVYPQARPIGEVGQSDGLTTGPLRQSAASVPEALAWLRDAQQSSGYWEDTPATRVRDTSLLLNTMTTFDGLFQRIGDAEVWLGQQGDLDNDSLARRMSSRRTASERNADLEQLLARQNRDGGWGVSEGYQSDAMDTALVLRAIAPYAGSDVTSTAVNYLLAQQGGDGGWPAVEASQSQVSVTALAMNALREAGVGGEPIVNAADYLVTRQKPDGGFGAAQSTVHDTAQVITSLLQSGYLDQIDLAAAAGYLAENQTVAGDWDGSVYTTALAVQALQSANFANWAITETSVTPDTINDGERAQLSAVITNDGRDTSEPTIARVYSGAEVDSAALLSGNIQVPAIRPRESVVVDFYWDSLGQPGENEFTFAVDPDDTTIEKSELDNVARAMVNVLPAPEGIDLELNDGAVTVNPASPTFLPSGLSISVALRNAGTEPASQAVVRLLRIEPGKDAIEVADQVVGVPARQTSVVNFTDQLMVSGTTQYRAVVDPEGVIDEADEGNNQGTASVTTQETIDFVVSESSVSMQPTTAYVNEDAEFTVVVRNQGTLAAPPTTVRYTIASNGSTQVLRENNIVLDGGESIENSLPWRVDSAGPKKLIVEIDPAGSVTELDETNNRFEFEFGADVLQGTNASVAFADIVASPKPLLEGYGATLEASVRNNGTESLTGVDVRFYIGNPAIGGVELDRSVIPSIAPGEIQSASVVWPTVPDSSKKLVYVVVDPENQIEEFDESDNQAFQSFEVKALPDLEVGEGSISLAPDFPKKGEQATIAVAVNNAGIQAAEQVVVQLYEGVPGSGGLMIGETTVPVIEGQSSDSVAFDYLFDNEDDNVRLVALVNDAKAIQEKSYQNNRAERLLSVQSKDFYVTERFISPDEDGVKDTSRFSFRLGSPQTVTLSIKTSGGREVLAVSGDGFANVSSGSFEWDGRNDFGGIVVDDDYSIEVIDATGQALGASTITVDTNRSALLKAEGTQYERITELQSVVGQAGLNIAYGITYTANDEFAVFSGYPADQDNPNGLIKGIYRSTVFGGQVTPIVDFSNIPELSNKSYVSEVIASPKSDAVVFRDNDDVWAASIQGGAPSKLLEESDLKYEGANGERDGRWEHLYISYEGQWLVYFKEMGDDIEIGRVALDGTSPPEALLVLEQYRGVGQVFPSPKSASVFLIAYTQSYNSELLFIDPENRSYRLLKDFNSTPNSDALQWAPDGHAFAVGESDYAELTLYSSKGDVLEAKAYYEQDSSLSISKVRWNQNSLELAYSVERNFWGGESITPSSSELGDPCDPESDYTPVSGIYLWNTVTGDIERPIVVTERENCNGGYGGYGEFSFRSEIPLEESSEGGAQQPYFVDATSQFWLYVDPQDWEWSPGERRILVSPGYVWYLESVNGLLAVDVEQPGEYEAVFRDWPDSNVNSLQASKTGRRLFLDDVAFDSLLNQSLDLRALRSRAAGGVALSGTAADLNFDRYELDYAESGAEQVWKSIAPDSLLPLVDDDMTVWVPPGPASYYVRLTGHDKAGNVRRKLNTTSWGDQASITDLYRDPGYISPNGDNRQDDVSLNLRVLQPVNLVLKIFNDEDQLVRTIKRSYDLIGSEQSIIWDGRDEFGVVVEDGRYRLELGKYKYEVTVDSTAPSIALGEVKDLLQPSCIPGSCGEGPPYVALSRNLPYQFEDQNYYRYQIEKGLGAGQWETISAGEFDPDQKVGDLQLSVSSLDELDRIYRIVVEDLAGNRSIKPFDLTNKTDKLILRSGTSHFDESGELKFQNGLLPYSYYDSIPEEIGLDYELSRFTIVESIQSETASVSMLYREQESPESGWREIAVTEFVAPDCIDSSGPRCLGATERDFKQTALTENTMEFLLDLSVLNRGTKYDLKARIVDVDGKTYTSNGAFLAPKSIFGITNVVKAPEKTWEIETLITEAPFAVSDEYVLVTSASDPRFLTETKIERTEIKTASTEAGLPDTTRLGYVIEDIVPCAEYSFKYVLVNSVGDEEVSEDYPTTLGCTRIEYVVRPDVALECGAGPTNRLLLNAGIFRPEDSDPRAETDEYQVLAWEIEADDGSENQILFTQNNPDVGKDYPFTLDTTEFSEGVLDITIRAVKESGESISEQFELPIDRTPPEVSVVSPEDNGKVCATEFLNSDGDKFRAAPIQGDVIDPRGSAIEYSVNYSVDGIPSSSSSGLGFEPNAKEKLNQLLITNRDAGAFEVGSEISYAESGQPVFASAARRTISGANKLLGNVGIIALDGASEIEFTLSVQDFGTHNQCVSQSFYLDAAVEGLLTTSRYNIISPNGDGNRDFGVIDMTLGEDAVTGLSIHEAIWSEKNQQFHPAANSLFEVFESSQAGAGQSEILWDGSNAGTTVPDGNYFMVLSVRDACGNTDIKEHLVEVDSTPPDLALEYPQNGDPIALNVEVLGSAYDENLVSYRIEYRVDGDSNWAFINGGRNSVVNDVLGRWNTFGLKGAIEVRLVAADRAENLAEIVRPFEIAERTNLLSYVETGTPYFSPNGDGRKDKARLILGILEPVTLEINLKNSDGEQLKTLALELETAPGEFEFFWDGAEVPEEDDGRYVLEVIARAVGNQNLQQTESASVVVDRTVPVIEIAGVENGFAKSNLLGSVTDANLESYVYSRAELSAGGDLVEALSGDTSVVGELLELISKDSIAEGEYRARLIARDLAGNRTEKTIDYVVDLTPPLVEIAAPENGSVTGDLLGPFTIDGSIEDKFLKSYTVGYRLSGQSEVKDLFTSTSLPIGAQLASLPISDFPEGSMDLVVSAVDLAGHVSSEEIQIVVDNSDPVVSLENPGQDGYLNRPFIFMGTVDDVSLDNYSVGYVLADQAANDDAWTSLIRGTRNITDGNLAYVTELPADGDYRFRLRAVDLVGHEASKVLDLTVDTVPPSRPVLQSLETVEGTGVKVAWQANEEDDLAGYQVLRGGQRLNADLIQANEFLDEILSEGTFGYQIVAVDLAGNESEPSDLEKVRVDWTPPAVSLTNPLDQSLVSGLVDVRGTAFSEDDFKEYRLSIGQGENPLSWQPLDRSPLSQTGSELTQWDTLLLGDNQTYTLRLEAEDLTGNVAETRVLVDIDNTPPEAPLNLTAALTDNDVALSWDASPEPDLAGYYLFLNGRLVNAEAPVIGDLSPYLITEAIYNDIDRADGTHQYLVYAVDKAGNVSDSSEPVDVDIETRPPHVEFEAPDAQVDFENNLRIEGVSEDIDVALVSYEYRMAGSSDPWVQIAEISGDQPFEYLWDTGSLAYGSYELQAVATDSNNNVDPEPALVQVNKLDLTRPESADDVQASVDGSTVSVSWSANQETDLAGYFIERQDTTGTTERLNEQPVIENSYQDLDVPDSSYRYRIVAVDLAGNEAEVSDAATARVYSPDVVPPFSPAVNPAFTLEGSAPLIDGGTAEGRLENILGSQVLAPMPLGDDGSFEWNGLELQPGQNLVSVVVADADGNRSRVVEFDIVKTTLPPTPQEVTAQAMDKAVTINWQDNSGTAVLGYRVFDGNGDTLESEIKAAVTSADGNSAFPTYYPASKAVDGSVYSYFQPIQTQDEYSALSVELAETSYVRQVTLRGYYDNSRYLPDFFDIEVWTGSYWLPIASGTANQAVVEFDQPYLTDRVRLVPTSRCYYSSCRIAEFEVYAEPLISGFEYTANNQSDGFEVYAVSAVSELGVESERAEAQEVAVGDVQPPEPVVLSGNVENEHDVVLTWEASTSADVTGYRIYRNAELLSVTSAGATTYSDVDLSNGIYVYAVRAEDNAGNLSTYSNERSFEISAAIEAAPENVTATAVPEGGKLQISWEHANPEDLLFRLYRAESIDGPFEEIKAGQARRFLDTGLVNGKTYFYRVTVSDWQGNTSEPSEVVQGVPRDIEKPEAPVLLSPVLEGESITVAAPDVAIAGFAEPGSQVGVFLRDNMMDPVIANEIAELRAIDGGSNQAGPISPDGNHMIASSYRQVSVIAVSDGAESWSGALGDELRNPMWINSSMAVGLSYDNVNSYDLRALLIDNESQAVEFLTIAGVDDYDVDGIAVLPETRELIMLIDSEQFDFESGIYIVDPMTGAITDGFAYEEWGYYADDTLVFSEASRMLAWVDSSNDRKVTMLNIDTGETFSTEKRAYSRSGGLSWSPDGQTLLFVDDSRRLAKYSLQNPGVETISGITESLYPVEEVSWTVGSKFLARVGYGLWQGDIAEQTVRATFDSDVRGTQLYDILWNVQSGLVTASTSNSNNLAVIQLAGRFETPEFALQSGLSSVFAVSQDLAGNESDASGVGTLEYNLANNPDFAIGVSVEPRIPTVSNSAEISLFIENLGELTSPETSLTLAVVMPDGNVEVLLDEAEVSQLPAGSQIPRQIVWQVPAVSGEYSLVATVDGNNQIREISESNNTVIKEVSVVDDGQVVLKSSLNGAEFSSREDVITRLQLLNPGRKFQGSLTVHIEDTEGYLVETLISSQSRTLVSGETVLEEFTWNTGTTFAGDYRLVAVLQDTSLSPVSSTSKPFAITANVDPVMSVSTNRSTYGPNEQVTLTTSVSNDSANATLAGTELGLTVKDSDGVVVFEEARELSEVNPGDVQSVNAVWNTDRRAPGIFDVLVELRDDSGILLADSANTFVIKAGAPVLPANLITDDSVAAGNPLEAQFNVSNAGNSRLENLVLSLNLIDAQSGGLISDSRSDVSLSVDEVYTQTSSFLTDGLPLGSYRVQLVAEFEFEGVNQQQVLDTTSARLFDADAPNIEILSPAAGSIVNGVSAKLTIAASDSLSGIADVEVSVDGGAWQSLPPAVVNYFYGLDSLAEGPHDVLARSVDNAGNRSLPVGVSFVIDNQIPGISISGVQYDRYYNYPVVPEVEFVDATTTRLELNGDAFTSGTPVQVEASYRLFAYAEDEAGNSVRDIVDFVVDRTDPSITVEGVSDGQLLAESVSPVVTVDDLYLESYDVKLNGQPFTSGDLIVEDGDYELTVNAKDKAGNSASVSYGFDIDTTPPNAPDITNFSDGDVVETDVLLLEGQAEPKSVVDVTFGTQSLSTLADDSGFFALSGLELEEGEYNFTFTATDRAGNVSEPSTLSITIRRGSSLTVEGNLTAKSHVLVWVPERVGHGKGPKHKPGHKNAKNDFDELVHLIGGVYEIENVDYSVVRNEADFVQALRSQRFNVLMIGSLKPSFGHPLKMSYATELEIRGVVGAGTGLIWINNHPHLFELWHDVIGARSYGALPHVETVDLERSPATVEGSWQFEGRHGVRVLLTGGVGVGQLATECKPHWHLWKYYSDCAPGWWKHHDEHKNPALVINKYGAGSVAMFTFNPASLVDEQAAGAMISDATRYATPDSSALFSESVFDIEWRLTEIEPPKQIAAIQRVSGGVDMVGSVDGDVVDERTVTWNKEILGTSTTLSSQARFTEMSEEQATIEIYDTAIGAGTLLAEGAIDLPVELSRADIELKYMELLEGIDHSILEYWPVHKAMIHAQSALSRDLSKHEQIEWAIWDIRKSLAWLSHVEREKAGEAIIWGGRLLKQYQAIW